MTQASVETEQREGTGEDLQGRKEGGVIYGGTSFTMKSPVTSSRTVAMEGR